LEYPLAMTVPPLPWEEEHESDLHAYGNPL
jgi:hypothetical protein